MPKPSFADIPGQRRFDAGLRDLISHGQKLTIEAQEKLASAKAARQKAAFEKLSKMLAEHTAQARQIRHVLWEELG